MNFKHRLGNIIQAFITIFSNLIIIITLGFWIPKWEMYWILYRIGKGRKFFYQTKK